MRYFLLSYSIILQQVTQLLNHRSYCSLILSHQSVILPQLAKVDWSGIANGVLTNLPGIIQASANAAGKVRHHVSVAHLTQETEQ